MTMRLFNGLNYTALLTITVLCLSGLTSLAQVATQAWVQRYSHTGDANDRAQKVVVDIDGNLIVAGNTTTGVAGADWLIIKYTSTGAPLWTNRYNGPGNNADQANSAAVGSNGEIYVTGYSWGGSSSQYDYATIAYSSAGVPLWTNRYDGSANSFDEAKSVAVGANGNIYVTGYSYGNGSLQDYATIAYSSAGLPLWTNRYNGLWNSEDQANAVVVGDNGNVCVTGYSYGTFGTSDYATIAYSDSGVPLWTNRYNGGGLGYDRANALAIGSDGNVYATGYSYGLGSSSDYATIAYSVAGVPLWTNRYDGPDNIDDVSQAVVLGSNGNLYVTGYSYGSTTFYDYATIAYSGAGVPLWTNRYSRLGYSDDEANCVAVGANGNIYVAGYSYSSGSLQDYATIAYSEAGVPLWTNFYNGPANFDDKPSAMAVSTNGTVYVTGCSYSSSNSGSGDFATLAYSGAGMPLWTNSYKGQGNYDDRATAVAVGRDGNIFVTGYSYDSGSFSDYATIAYSSAGAPLWVRRYNGLGNRTDNATSVSVGANSNVYVTGDSFNAFDNRDYATIAYSDAGLPLWTNRYNGSANGDDRATAVIVGANGNVIVAGYSDGFNSSYDFATIAYSDAGVALWTRRYTSPGNNHDIARAVAVGSNGNIYVTGYSYYTSNSYDYATIAYSVTGVPLWTNRYNSPSNSSDIASAVAVGNDGTVFVTGYSYDGNSYDYATLAYSSAGLPLWTNRYTASSNGSDLATAVAVGNDGTVFVTGYSYDSGSSNDYATIAYSGNGVPLWTNRYNGVGNGDDQARSVAVSTNGNVYVTGYSYGGGSGDFATIAYSSAGIPLWTNRYNGPANGTDEPSTSQSLAVTPDGVVVIGSSDGDFGDGTICDYAVVKYTNSGLTVTGVNPFTLNIFANLSNGAFQFGFTNGSGVPFTVLSSTNVSLPLNQWLNLGPAVETPISSGQFLFTDTQATNHRTRFYRVRSP